MNMKKYTLLLALLLVGVLTGYSQQSAYLFVYFTGNRMSESETAVNTKYRIYLGNAKNAQFVKLVLIYE